VNLLHMLVIGILQIYQWGKSQQREKKFFFFLCETDSVDNMFFA